MARQRQQEGAEVRRGVFGVPRGTIESLQFCKNGVLRIARSARGSDVRVVRRGENRRGV